ncbi:uncharacterized protein [Parasteatoda tepidariorum]|uniref:uncharacterized protein isoform X1 n=1 Tax=Parasteatoda tepidariorum TaxID=114398 RepID=UPI001C721D59|nr:uncharacterized protein LOC107451332 isoform X1 [Parasteatoda tepidariorum]
MESSTYCQNDIRNYAALFSSTEFTDFYSSFENSLNMFQESDRTFEINSQTQAMEKKKYDFTNYEISNNSNDFELNNYPQYLPPLTNQNFLKEINAVSQRCLPSNTETVFTNLDDFNFEKASHPSMKENQWSRTVGSPDCHRKRGPPPPYRPLHKEPPPPYAITQSWIDSCNNFKNSISDQDMEIISDDWATEVQNSDFFSSENDSDFHGSRSETPSPYLTAKWKDSKAGFLSSTVAYDPTSKLSWKTPHSFVDEASSDSVRELSPPSKKYCYSSEDEGWNYKNSQIVQLPKDLVEWNEKHVSLWLKWFSRTFYDYKPDLNLIPSDGVALNKLTLTDFITITGDWKVANMLWDDILPYKRELFGGEEKSSGENGLSSQEHLNTIKDRRKDENLSTIKDRILQRFVTEKKKAKNDNGGQTPLWQFLLELLSKQEHSDKIEWEGVDGTFKLKLPDDVAKMWGQKKKKKGMTYEKLSRSLRYYYDKQIMSKVNGKRFSYKFDLDGLIRAYHPTGVSDSCFIQADDLNCPSRNFPFTAFIVQKDIQKSEDEDSPESGF